MRFSFIHIKGENACPQKTISGLRGLSMGARYGYVTPLALQKIPKKYHPISNWKLNHSCCLLSGKVAMKSEPLLLPNHHHHHHPLHHHHHHHHQQWLKTLTPARKYVLTRNQVNSQSKQTPNRRFRQGSVVTQLLSAPGQKMTEMHYR